MFCYAFLLFCRCSCHEKNGIETFHLICRKTCMSRWHSFDNSISILLESVDCRWNVSQETTWSWVDMFHRFVSFEKFADCYRTERTQLYKIETFVNIVKPFFEAKLGRLFFERFVFRTFNWNDPNVGYQGFHTKTFKSFRSFEVKEFGRICWSEGYCKKLMTHTKWNH